MDMEVKPLFWGPLLIQLKVADELVRSLLIEGQQQSKDYRYALAGRIEKERLYSKPLTRHFSNQIKPYIDVYIEVLSKHFKQQSVNPYTLEIDNLWINFQRPGEYNPIHNHNCDISFVMYLQVSDEIQEEENTSRSAPNGSITFRYGTPFSDNSKSLFHPVIANTHLPKKGDMFIFPSYLEHHVEAFYTPGAERTSVSGNFFVRWCDQSKESVVPTDR